MNRGKKSTGKPLSRRYSGGKGVAGGHAVVSLFVPQVQGIVRFARRSLLKYEIVFFVAHDKFS